MNPINPLLQHLLLHKKKEKGGEEGESISVKSGIEGSRWWLTVVDSSGLNRRETTWELESYRRHTLYDALRLDDRARSPSLVCEKHGTRSDRSSFLMRETFAKSVRLCGAPWGRGRVRVHAYLHLRGHVLRSWGTVFYRNQSSSPHSLARLPGNSVFRHEPPPRHYPIGRDFEAAWPNLIFDRGISARCE